jgi:hypothetical protein
LHRKSSPRSPAINRSLTRRIFSQITSTCDRAGGRQLQGFRILTMLAATYRSKPFVLPDVRFSLHPRSPSHSQRVRLQVRDRPTGYDRIIRPFEEWYKSVSTSISRLPSSSKPVVITNRPASVRLFGPIDQRAYQQAMSIYYRPAQLTRRLRRGKHRRGHRTEMVGRLDLSIVDPIPSPRGRGFGVSRSTGEQGMSRSPPKCGVSCRWRFAPAHRIRNTYY